MAIIAGCMQLSVVSHEEGHYQSVRLLSHYHGCDVAALIFWQRGKMLEGGKKRKMWRRLLLGKKINFHIIDHVR